MYDLEKDNAAADMRSDDKKLSVIIMLTYLMVSVCARLRQDRRSITGVPLGTPLFEDRNRCS